MAYPIIPREEWSEDPAGEASPLTPPFDRVILTMESRFKKCTNTSECVARMREIEEYYIENGLCEDFPYNFMVASDGNVYEGRGWYKKPLKAEIHEEFSESTIDIGVLGVTSKRIPSLDHKDETLEMAKRFVNHYVKKQMIKDDYYIHAFEGGKRLF